MVSLTRSFHTSSGGATFFSESGNMGDNEHLQPILENYGIFKPLKTIPVVTLHFWFTFVLEVIAILFAFKHPDEKSRCQEYFILIYAHIGLWFFTLLIDQIVRVAHFNLRINGYLDFYNKTYFHHRVPLYVVSLWNATIMLIQALIQQFYPEDFAERCIKGGIVSPIGYISSLITLEFCVLAAISIHYIFQVRKFNKLRMPPDVQVEEWTAGAYPESLSNRSEVGSRAMGDKLFDLLQKQANLIRFLKEHNARLGEKLMLSSAQHQARRSETVPTEA